MEIRMELTSRIRFRIAFQGSASCWKDAHVGAVDVHGPKSEVYAHSPDGRESKLYEGALTWSIPNKDTPRPFFQSRKELEQISLPADVAKTMSLSARVFEHYENHRHLTMQYDGTTTPELRARRHDIGIILENQAALEEGNSYLIKIKNIGERTLRAEFIKQEEGISRAPRPAPSTPPAPPARKESVEEMTRRNLRDCHLSEKAISTITAGTSSLLSSIKTISAATLRGAPTSAPAAAVEVMDTAFAGLLSMNQTLVRSHAEGNPELDDLSVEELKARFEAEKKELDKARIAFDRACSAGNPFAALEHKQAVSKNLIALEAALNRKGVFFPGPV
jgi:hypothetical protein